MAEEHPPRRAPSYLTIDKNKLRTLRQERAFATQAQLSRRTGLSRATISLLETGKRRASPAALRSLCQALNCVPADLLSTEEGNNATKAPAGGER
jgi:DNA-binding Xre family transcriptional regulator